MNAREFILIPFWIERVLTRNNLPIETVLNYGELNKVLSTADIAQARALENYEINVLMLGLSNCALWHSWKDSAQGSQLTELDFVDSLSQSSEIVNDMLNRLGKEIKPSNYFGEPVPAITDIEEPLKSFFKVIDINKDFSGIIVNDTFFKSIAVKENTIELVRSVLKNLYIYYTVAEVANFKVFDKYIELLQ